MNKLKKWLVYRLTGTNIDLIDHQLEFFRNEIKEIKKDYRQLATENSTLRNQVLFMAPKILLAKDNIVTLQHQVCEGEDSKKIIAEEFKDTLLKYNLFSYSEVPGKPGYMEGTIRIIRP